MPGYVFDHDAGRPRPPSKRLLYIGAGTLVLAGALLAGWVLRSDGNDPPPDPKAEAEARALARKLPSSSRLQGEALIEAARMGHGALVIALLERGVDPDVRDARGWSALSWAVQSGEASIVRRLIAAGAKLGAADRAMGSDLHLAAMRDDPLMLGILLAAGAEIDAPAPALDGASALHVACESGNLRSAGRLVRAQADLEARDARGFTPLARATLLGKGEMVDFLLSRGVDARIRDARGRTALHLAATSGDAACARALLDAGLDADQRDGARWTPLHYAAAHGHAKLVDLLAHARNAEALAARTSRGMTALHLAARLGSAECVEKLLDAGVDPLLTDESDRLARDFAPPGLTGLPWNRLSPSNVAAKDPADFTLSKSPLLDAGTRPPAVCLCTHPARTLRGPLVLLDLAIWDDGAAILAPWESEGGREYLAGVLSPAAVRALRLDLDETGWLDEILPAVDSAQQDRVELRVERNGVVVRTSFDEIGTRAVGDTGESRAARLDLELGWSRVRDVLRSARPVSTQELTHVLVEGAFRGLTFADGAHAAWME